MNGSESTKGTRKAGRSFVMPKKAAPHSYRTCTHLRGKPLKTRVSDKGKKTSWGRSSESPKAVDCHGSVLGRIDYWPGRLTVGLSEIGFSSEVSSALRAECVLIGATSSNGRYRTAITRTVSSLLSQQISHNGEPFGTQRLPAHELASPTITVRSVVLIAFLAVKISLHPRTFDAFVLLGGLRLRHKQPI